MVYMLANVGSKQRHSSRVARARHYKKLADEILLPRSLKNNPNEEPSLRFSEPLSEKEIFDMLIASR